MRPALLLVVLAALLSTAAPAQAQTDPPTRSGFFIGFGADLGALALSDADGREAGPGGFFTGGFAVNPRLFAGLEINGWLGNEEAGTGEVDFLFAQYLATGHLFPLQGRGLFLKGGLGLSTLEVTTGNRGGSNTRTGFGALVGVGYDIRVGENVAISPYGTLGYGTFDDVSANVVHVGVGVTGR